MLMVHHYKLACQLWKVWFAVKVKVVGFESFRMCVNHMFSALLNLLYTTMLGISFVNSLLQNVHVFIFKVKVRGFESSKMVVFPVFS